MRLVTLVFLTAALATSAAAQQSPDYINCQDIKRPAEARILACSRVIDTPSYGPATMTQMYLFRSIAYRSKREFESAMQDIGVAMKMAPGDQMVLTIAGGLTRDIGALDTATDLLQTAVGMRKMHAPSVYEAGLLEATKGNHHLAIELYTGV